jgi:hexosaminidase
MENRNKKYPKLTEVGAWRDGSQVGRYIDMKFDDKRYGGFYTQEQVKDVVAMPEASYRCYS